MWVNKKDKYFCTKIQLRILNSLKSSVAVPTTTTHFPKQNSKSLENIQNKLIMKAVSETSEFLRIFLWVFKTNKSN